MTEIDPLGARLAIQNAQFALQRGNNAEARRLAIQAAQFDPTFEDPWLILATVSSPRASVAYLQHALELNPRSDRATRGMQWALERLGSASARQTIEVHSPTVSDTQPVKTAPPPPRPSQTPFEPPLPDSRPAVEEGLDDSFMTDADLWESFQAQEKLAREESSGVKPAKEQTQPVKIIPVQKQADKKQKKAKPANKLTCATLALIAFIVICAIVIIWIALPSWAALANSSSTALPADVFGKPTLTATSTATPTVTPTPLPTATPTPLPTNTPEPTLTPEPPTPVPTDIPYVEPTAGGDFSGRWIDIDLTNQMLYAYEDNTLVNSFLVSTGVAAHPTVTGQYYIYVKYVSTLMTGPGYYLPDVPYTMYFYEGYGIHGTYWHNNFGNPMSHGCVNMRTSEAEWMFNWASVGTLVNIHY